MALDRGGRTPGLAGRRRLLPRALAGHQSYSDCASRGPPGGNRLLWPRLVGWLLAMLQPGGGVARGCGVGAMAAMADRSEHTVVSEGEVVGRREGDTGVLAVRRYGLVGKKDCVYTIGIKEKRRK